MSRLRARLASEEHGITLVELLVVISIVTLVGGFAVASLVQGMQTSRYSQDRVDALAATQTGLERMSRELRAADPLRAADADAVALDIRRGGWLYHYQYETQADGASWELVETRWGFDDPDDFDAAGFVPTESGAQEVTESVLVADLAEPDVFAFTDEDGNGGASASEARHVEITVERNVQAGGPVVEVETTVKMRNQ